MGIPLNSQAGVDDRLAGQPRRLRRIRGLGWRVQESPERIHQDLAEWGILESDAPIRFTKRFQGALARAAAQLQQLEASGAPLGGNAVENQVEAAMAAHLKGKGKRVGLGHRRFVVAVHLAGLPEAVRKVLGL
jgi:hypothetical protein